MWKTEPYNPKFPGNTTIKYFEKPDDMYPIAAVYGHSPKFFDAVIYDIDQETGKAKIKNKIKKQTDLISAKQWVEKELK